MSGGGPRLPAVQRVVVAHEADAIRDAALGVVRSLGLEGVGVTDGLSARALVFARPAPSALVLDVGLPEVMAFQIVDDLRAQQNPLPVVLIASVYSRTAYKRRPTSLHGADDYVEQHHVPDQLGAKLMKLLRGGGGEASEPSEMVARDIRRAGEARMSFRYATRDEAIERARKLAEVVVADLLLYGDGTIDEAHSRQELEVGLGGDLQAARDFLSLRVPAEIFALEDFVGAALAAVVAARRRAPEDAGK
jgi:DNA-binding response OmpR family regulator